MSGLNTGLKKHSAATHVAIHGLSLARSVLNALQKRGIYCQSAVSVEHRHLANRYVLRGVESGGAVSDIGRACAFIAGEGKPLPWFQRIDSIGVNGRHAIYLAESLVRLEMLRVGRTCELVVTSHTLSCLPGRTRPEIVSQVIFHGRDGTLPVGLWKPEERALRGCLMPEFYSRAGEVLGVPKQFECAIKKLTACVCCIGYKHSHVGVPPGVEVADKG